MKKIDVLTFVEEYKNAEDKNEYIESHIIRTYIPFEEKRAIINRIIDITCYTQIGEGENKVKIFRLDSGTRYLFYTLEMIRNYTDIEIQFTDGAHLGAYNILCECGVISNILGCIPQGEVDEMCAILNMTLEDSLENNRSFAGYLDAKFGGLGIFMDKGLSILDKFMDKIIKDDKFINKIKDKVEKIM